MDPVSLSVSQLRCAVLDTEWRERFKRGENPSTQQYAPPGTVTVHGQKFHSFVYDWVTQLVREGRGSADLSTDALVGFAQNRGAGAFISQLLEKGEIESASALTEALHRFAQRLGQLRQRCEHFTEWKDVFLGQELAVNHVNLEVGGPRLIFVSGTMDCLRRHPNGSIEIVDYKLTQGAHLDLEIVQIALYQRLLHNSDPNLPLRGALEYFYPSLHVTEVNQSSLQRVYDTLVVPALEDLSHAGASASASVPGAVVGAPDATGSPATVSLPTARVDRSTVPSSATAARVPDTTQAAPTASPAPSLTKPDAAATRPGAATTPSSLPPTSEFRIELGTSRGVRGDAVFMPAADFTRHTGVLGGSGSGKTTLALNMVEQLLGGGVPVLLVDRKGDLCRYADPQAAQGGLQQLLPRVDVALFTPGHAGGRNLGIGIVPDGLSELERTEREQAYSVSAQALASMMNYSQGASSQAKIAVLKRALGILADQQRAIPVSIGTLIELVNSQDPALMESIGALNPKHCDALSQDLQTLEILQGQLLTASDEMLNAELLFGLGNHAVPGKTRLSIISTKFLGDEKVALFWVAQLLVELSRYCSRNPATTLQAVVMFDEADIYLPAASKPVTKPPMESLLKRARSAGLGVMLATQSPGDLDYKCRENVRSWFMGLVKEKTALEKIKPMTQEVNLDASALLPKQKVGQFFMVTEKTSVPFLARRSLLQTEQLSEADILRLAAATKEPPR